MPGPSESTLTKRQQQVVQLLLKGLSNKEIAGTSTSITKTTFPNFRRGDANQDGQVNRSDPVWTNNALFSGGPQPHCWDAVDSNDDGNADLSDSVWTLNSLFQSGPEPPAPGPFTCGPDPTSDSLTCLEYHPSC